MNELKFLKLSNNIQANYKVLESNLSVIDESYKKTNHHSDTMFLLLTIINKDIKEFNEWFAKEGIK